MPDQTTPQPNPPPNPPPPQGAAPPEAAPGPPGERLSEEDRKRVLAVLTQMGDVFEAALSGRGNKTLAQALKAPDAPLTHVPLSEKQCRILLAVVRQAEGMD